MPRSVSGQAALDAGQTNICWALRIDPRGGPAFGLCNTNVDQRFNDGQGLVTYMAAYGYDETAVAATSGQGVDNSEAQALFAPLADFGITVEMVDTGYLDGAKFHQYAYDYVTGEIVSLVHYGYLGQVRYVDKQLVIPDLVSLSMLAKQKGLCEAGSTTCRAIDTDASTGCPRVPTWVMGPTVTSEGVDEPDRVFGTAATVPSPGIVKWLTGLNAGRYSVVESFNTGVVALKHPAPYPIAAGDTFDVRDLCDKKWETCKAFLGGAAVTSFRGEPFRLESIGDALQTPGATTR